LEQQLKAIYWQTAVSNMAAAPVVCAQCRAEIAETRYADICSVCCRAPLCATCAARACPCRAVLCTQCGSRDIREVHEPFRDNSVLVRHVCPTCGTHQHTRKRVVRAPRLLDLLLYRASRAPPGAIDVAALPVPLQREVEARRVMFFYGEQQTARVQWPPGTCTYF
jgi:hypothetical protein